MVRIFDPTATKPGFETEAFTTWDAIPGLKDTAIRAYTKLSTAPSVKCHYT